VSSRTGRGGPGVGARARPSQAWVRRASSETRRRGRAAGEGRRRRLVAATAALLLLAAAGLAQSAPSYTGDGFLRATSGRPIELPRDHGRHPATRTEWWYLTGPLRAADGRLFGFQATWFRRAMIDEVADGRSPMAVRDVMLFHGALTDPRAGRVRFTERACRAWRPWASAAEDRLDVRLLGHELVALDEDARRARLAFGAGEARLDLELELGACAPLLHGAEPGLSIKGDEPGQASWYYSLPRIPATGTITFGDGERVVVSGRAWLDQEFGSSQLSADQVGWDWFSVALDDGTDLMLYRMRLRDGTADATSSGTIRRPADEGPGRHLPRDAFTIEVLGTWTSEASGATYPSGWRLRVPSERLELLVEPVLEDQELLTPGSTGVTYWEGLCRFTGTRAGRPVAGEGYVELVGYDERFTERL